MDPNLQQFQSAINGANDSPSGNIFTNYAASQSKVDQSNAGTAAPMASANANVAAIQQSNAEAAAKVAAQRAQDASDPSKAQMRELPNNQGYAFYDGTGQRLNINQYSLLTGKTPAQLLANSPNPQDQKFVQDYNTLQALSTAWVNGDKKTLATMRAADPQKFNQIISTYKSPAAMVKAFTQHWSSYYGNQGTQTASTPAFAPQEVNTPTSAQAKSLSATTLAQTLTPDTLKKPSYSIGGTILSHIPGTSENQAVNQYNGAQNANPWDLYQTSLNGS